MKIRVLSDLHLELVRARFGEGLDVPMLPPGACDVTVLAGDIDGSPELVMRSFAGWNTPVIYVAGNHEWYGGQDMASGLPEAGKRIEGSLVWLENGVHQIGDVVFIGATLWTDYAYRGSKALAMAVAERSLNDHRRIRLEGQRFSALHALSLHQRSRAYLEGEIQKALAVGHRIVLVTHHGVSYQSIPSVYADDLLSAAFSSELFASLEGVSLCLHGHTHTSFDYRLPNQIGTRVVVNPRGYPLRNASSDARCFENPHFKLDLVVEV